MAKFDVLSKVAAIFKSDRGVRQQPRLTELGSTAVSYVEDGLTETGRGGRVFVSSSPTFNATADDLSPPTANLALYNFGPHSIAIDRIGFVDQNGSVVLQSYTLMAALSPRNEEPSGAQDFSYVKASTNGNGSLSAKGNNLTSNVVWQQLNMVANLPTSLTWFQVLSGGVVETGVANAHKWMGNKVQFNGEIIIRPNWMLIFALVMTTAGILSVGSVEVTWQEYNNGKVRHTS